MKFKNYFIIFLMSLLSFNAIQAVNFTFLNYITMCLSSRYFLGEAYRTKLDRDFSKKYLAEKMSSQANKQKSPQEKLIHDYVLKRAQALGINTKNLLVTIDENIVGYNADATSFTINNSEYSEIKVCPQVAKDIEEYLTHGAINPAPVLLEHELTHIKHKDAKNYNLFKMSSALGFSTIMGTLFMRNSFIQDYSEYKDDLNRIAIFALIAPIAYHLMEKAYLRHSEKRADLEAINQLDDLKLAEAYKDLYAKIPPRPLKVGVRIIFQKSHEIILYQCADTNEHPYTKLTSTHPSYKDRTDYLSRAIKKLQEKKRI